MISVLIPALNAAERLPDTLAALTPGLIAGLIKEAIVVDGGSSDQTRAIAEAAGCVVLDSARGRGQQLRAGAGAARAPWLLFLHADTVLAPEWVGAAARFIADADNAERAGVFDLAFDDPSAAARFVVFWARLRARLLKLPYGDQGLLISRAFYDSIGGFADLPLMEDVDIVRRIGSRRLVFLGVTAVTSAEKYRRDGYQKRAWRNLGLLARYLLGADPRELAKRYD